MATEIEVSGSKLLLTRTLDDQPQVRQSVVVRRCVKKMHEDDEEFIYREKHWLRVRSLAIDVEAQVAGNIRVIVEGREKEWTLFGTLLTGTVSVIGPANRYSYIPVIINRVQGF
jgi:hypothetical protein